MQPAIWGKREDHLINAGIEDISLVETSLDFIVDMIGEMKLCPKLGQKVELSDTCEI